MNANVETVDSPAVRESNASGRSTFWTIGRKIVAAVAISVAIGFAAVITSQTISERDRLVEKAVQSNVEITQLLSAQLGGAVRFKKVDAMQKAYARLVDGEASNVASLTIFSADGAPIATHVSEFLGGTAISKLPDIGKEALAKSNLFNRKFSTHLLVAAPIMFGKGDTPVGVGVIAWDLTRLEKEVWDNAITQIGWAVGLSVLLILSLAFLLSRMVSRPIRNMTVVMNQLANGDRDVAVPATGRRDEIGNMAKALQVFKENALAIDRMSQEEFRRKEEDARRLADEEQARQQKLHDEEEAKRNEERLEREREQKAHSDKRQLMDQLATNFEASVKVKVDAVRQSAIRLQEIAKEMRHSADESSQSSNTVRDNAIEAAKHVQSVAASAEELSLSIQEISSQASISSNVATRAVSQAENTSLTVHEMANAADKINDVLEFISDIASQTNLLALNATIEAARAGEAGKGFAVVASEVKSLANQTTKATDEIAAQIHRMQSATANVVAAIKEIGSTIDEMNNSTGGISAAVEEQHAATTEIAQNTQLAANGTAEVTANVSKVSEIAETTGQSADNVVRQLDILAADSETLESEVASFIAQIRA